MTKPIFDINHLIQIAKTNSMNIIYKENEQSMDQIMYVIEKSIHAEEFNNALMEIIE